jgi:hypothetical protein
VGGAAGDGDGDDGDTKKGVELAAAASWSGGTAVAREECEVDDSSRDAAAVDEMEAEGRGEGDDGCMRGEGGRAEGRGPSGGSSARGVFFRPNLGACALPFICCFNSL